MEEESDKAIDDPRIIDWQASLREGKILTNYCYPAMYSWAVGYFCQLTVECGFRKHLRPIKDIAIFSVIFIIMHDRENKSVILS